MDKKRLNYIKQHLDWSKSFKTKTDNSWKPSVVGEFKHEDIEFLINTIELLQKENKLIKQAYADRCFDIDCQTETLRSIVKVLLSCSKINDKLKENEEIANGSLTDESENRTLDDWLS